MLTIPKEQSVFTFSKDHAPAASIHSGETVAFETYDCYYNQLLPENAGLHSLIPGTGNAATGPLYIHEAKPGDALKIEILDIVTGPLGVCVAYPDREWITPPYLGTFEKSLRKFAVQNGIAHFSDTISFPIRPMIGVIGTAPGTGDISTIVPDLHGGNMDCTSIRKGATLFLPVFVPGALLALGDLHAVMGDGEVCGCGLEIEGTVTLRISVVENPPFQWPCVLTDSHFITIASAKTVNDAWKLAVKQTQELLERTTSMAPAELSMFLSMCGDLVICQTVDPNKTVRMEIPIDCFH